MEGRRANRIYFSLR